MKRMLFASLLLLAATNVFAVQRTVLVVDDVIRMSKAGVGDEEIIAFVKKSDERFDVTGDDVIAMTDAKVSRAVVKAVIDESSARMRDERADRRDRETRTRTVYVAPYYDPYYSYYDPWFSPRFYLGFSYGRGFHHFRRH